MLCRLRLLYTSLYAILARYTYCALPILLSGVVHRTLLTTPLARCSTYLEGGLGVMYANTQHYCEINNSLFYLTFYTSKTKNKKQGI
jgi:hypothetical protein